MKITENKLIRRQRKGQCSEQKNSVTSSRLNHGTPETEMHYKYQIASTDKHENPVAQRLIDI